MAQVDINTSRIQEIFQKYTIEEISKYQDQLKIDTSSINVQLKEVVGKSYRDIISSSDIIFNIAGKSQEIKYNFKQIQECTQKYKSRCQLRGMEQGQNDDMESYKGLIDLSKEIRYVIDSEDFIWSNLEKRNFLMSILRLTTALKVGDQLLSRNLDVYTNGEHQLNLGSSNDSNILSLFGAQQRKYYTQVKQLFPIIENAQNALRNLQEESQKKIQGFLSQEILQDHSVVVEILMSFLLIAQQSYLDGGQDFQQSGNLLQIYMSSKQEVVLSQCLHATDSSQATFQEFVRDFEKSKMQNPAKNRTDNIGKDFLLCLFKISSFFYNLVQILVQIQVVFVGSIRVLKDIKIDQEYQTPHSSVYAQSKHSLKTNGHLEYKKQPQQVDLHLYQSIFEAQVEKFFQQEASMQVIQLRKGCQEDIQNVLRQVQSLSFLDLQNKVQEVILEITNLAAPDLKRLLGSLTDMRQLNIFENVLKLQYQDHVQLQTYENYLNATKMLLLQQIDEDSGGGGGSRGAQQIQGYNLINKKFIQNRTFDSQSSVDFVLEEAAVKYVQLDIVDCNQFLMSYLKGLWLERVVQIIEEHFQNLRSQFIKDVGSMCSFASRSQQAQFDKIHKGRLQNFAQDLDVRVGYSDLMTSQISEFYKNGDVSLLYFQNLIIAENGGEFAQVSTQEESDVDAIFNAQLKQEKNAFLQKYNPGNNAPVTKQNQTQDHFLKGQRIAQSLVQDYFLSIFKFFQEILVQQFQQTATEQEQDCDYNPQDRYIKIVDQGDESSKLVVEKLQMEFVVAMEDIITYFQERLRSIRSSQSQEQSEKPLDQDDEIFLDGKTCMYISDQISEGLKIQDKSQDFSTQWNISYQQYDNLKVENIDLELTKHILFLYDSRNQPYTGNDTGLNNPRKNRIESAKMLMGKIAAQFYKLSLEFYSEWASIKAYGIVKTYKETLYGEIERHMHGQKVDFNLPGWCQLNVQTAIKSSPNTNQQQVLETSINLQNLDQEDMPPSEQQQGSIDQVEGLENHDLDINFNLPAVPSQSFGNFLHHLMLLIVQNQNEKQDVRNCIIQEAGNQFVKQLAANDNQESSLSTHQNEPLDFSSPLSTLPAKIPNPLQQRLQEQGMFAYLSDDQVSLPDKLVLHLLFDLSLLQIVQRPIRDKEELLRQFLQRTLDGEQAYEDGVIEGLGVGIQAQEQTSSEQISKAQTAQHIQDLIDKVSSKIDPIDLAACTPFLEERVSLFINQSQILMGSIFKNQYNQQEEPFQQIYLKDINRSIALQEGLQEASLMGIKQIDSRLSYYPISIPQIQRRRRDDSDVDNYFQIFKDDKSQLEKGFKETSLQQGYPHTHEGITQQSTDHKMQGQSQQVQQQISAQQQLPQTRFGFSKWTPWG